MMIETTRGPIEESRLERRDVFTECDTDTAQAVEYYIDGELVHRSVHVTLKDGLGSLMTQGDFNG